MRITPALFPLLIVTFLFTGASCRSTSFNATKNAPKLLATNDLTWQRLSSGIERRIYRSEENEKAYEFVVYRLNNKLFQLDLAYNQTPKRLEDWQKELGSILTINGGYFTEFLVPTGLFIDQGRIINEEAYDLDRSGTVAIENGQLRFLSSLPTNTSGLDLFQSFPLLINDGTAAITSDSEKTARRTVIGTDKEGRVLLLIVDKTPLSLYELALVLESTDLNVSKALNLDGGPSSGLLYNDGITKESFLPLVELPIVLSVSALPPDALNGR